MCNINYKSLWLVLVVFFFLTLSFSWIPLFCFYNYFQPLKWFRPNQCVTSALRYIRPDACTLSACRQCWSISLLWFIHSVERAFGNYFERKDRLSFFVVSLFHSHWRLASTKCFILCIGILMLPKLTFSSNSINYKNDRCAPVLFSLCTHTHTHLVLKIAQVH